MFMTALLLPLFVFDMSADDENAKMEIPLNLFTQQDLNRSLVFMPLTCHYYGMMTSLVTNVASDLGNVTLTVTNFSTGEVWGTVFDSAVDSQVILPISSTSGYYEVFYVTERGEFYLGNFTI